MVDIRNSVPVRLQSMCISRWTYDNMREVRTHSTERGDLKGLI